jgi:uncharacterized protein (TIGR02246 family)
MASDQDTRIAKLVAKEEIRDLKARYAEVCDAGFDPRELAELFTKDGVFNARGYGRFEGRDAIAAYFEAVPASLTWGLHYLTTPTIVVEDDLEHASGRWYFIEPCTMDGEAMWVMGRYDDRYRYEDGRWRFAEVGLTTDAVTPFEEGWVKRRFSASMEPQEATT